VNYLIALLWRDSKFRRTGGNMARTDVDFQVERTSTTEERPKRNFEQTDGYGTRRTTRIHGAALLPLQHARMSGCDVARERWKR
jgi:hypothetical protein